MTSEHRLRRHRRRWLGVPPGAVAQRVDLAHEGLHLEDVGGAILLGEGEHRLALELVALELVPEVVDAHRLQLRVRRRQLELLDARLLLLLCLASRTLACQRRLARRQLGAAGLHPPHLERLPCPQAKLRVTRFANFAGFSTV